MAFPRLPFSSWSLKKLLLAALTGIVVISSLATAGYFFYKYQTERQQNPEVSLQQTIAEVGKLMALPSDEKPTLATVTDKNKLQQQEFFKNAENGDRVLFYIQNQRAILYRPSTHRIIDVATIRQTGNKAPAATEQSSTASPSAKPQVSVSIYNGTSIAGLSKKIETYLTAVSKTDGPAYTVQQRLNAAKTDYTETIVVDQSGRHDAEAQTIAKKLAGKVEKALPDGETKVNSDIVIIAGSGVLQLNLSE